MSSHKLLPSLPRIKVPIGHIPQRLKTVGFENPRARLEVLRRMVCRTMREERCEFKYNRAVECRPYIERLIQLGVFRGPNDEYTMEMMKWWFIEQDVLDKMFDILVPRFRSYSTNQPYTNIYRLPKLRLKLSNRSLGGGRWGALEIAVLELKGNPFPELEPLEQQRRKKLIEVVKQGVLAKDQEEFIFKE